jgi:hypothetical protein
VSLAERAGTQGGEGTTVREEGDVMPDFEEGEIALQTLKAMPNDLSGADDWR